MVYDFLHVYVTSVTFAIFSHPHLNQRAGIPRYILPFAKPVINRDALKVRNAGFVVYYY